MLIKRLDHRGLSRANPSAFCLLISVKHSLIVQLKLKDSPLPPIVGLMGDEDQSDLEMATLIQANFRSLSRNKEREREKYKNREKYAAY